jgi:hypothetical protein
MEIVLVKQTSQQLTSEDAIVMRRFLFEYLDGSSDKDKKAWRGFCNSLNKAVYGQYFSIKLWRQRNSKFHRRHMKMESEIFKAQEKFEEFRIFRSWVKMGAGFVDYIPNRDGEIVAIPKSINFDDCSEEDMRQFHEDSMKFYRSEYCVSTLWPNLSAQIGEECINALLSPFERFGE